MTKERKIIGRNETNKEKRREKGKSYEMIKENVREAWRKAGSEGKSEEKRKQEKMGGKIEQRRQINESSLPPSASAPFSASSSKSSILLNCLLFPLHPICLFSPHC